MNQALAALRSLCTEGCVRTVRSTCVGVRNIIHECVWIAATLLFMQVRTGFFLVRTVYKWPINRHEKRPTNVVLVLVCGAFINISLIPEKDDPSTACMSEFPEWKKTQKHTYTKLIVCTKFRNIASRTKVRVRSSTTIPVLQHLRNPPCKLPSEEIECPTEIRHNKKLLQL